MSAACVHYWKSHTFIIACVYCGISCQAFFMRKYTKRANVLNFEDIKEFVVPWYFFSA